MLILSILRSYPIISHSGRSLGVQYSLNNFTLLPPINFSIDIIFNDFILFIVLILFFWLWWLSSMSHLIRFFPSSFFWWEFLSCFAWNKHDQIVQLGPAEFLMGAFLVRPQSGPKWGSSGHRVKSDRSSYREQILFIYHHMKQIFKFCCTTKITM